MNFYNHYIALCTLTGKTPSRVATELGLSKSVVSNWKTRGTNPTDSTLLKIANYFGMSLTDMLAFMHLNAKEVLKRTRADHDGPIVPMSEYPRDKQTLIATVFESCLSADNASAVAAAICCGLTVNPVTLLKNNTPGELTNVDILSYAKYLGCLDSVSELLREEAKKDAPLSEAARTELAVLFEEACVKKGITPAFACQRAGVNGGFVTRLRTWKAAPISHEELMALASFLDCADDVREILGEIEKEPTVLTDDKLNDFIKLFEAASPRLQEIALEILKVGESSHISQDASSKER